MPDNTLDNGNGFKLDIAQWRGETTQSMKDLKDDLSLVKTDIRMYCKELQSLNAKLDIVIREITDRISQQEKYLEKKETEYVTRFTKALDVFQKTVEADIQKQHTEFRKEIAGFKETINEQIKDLEINYTAESSKQNIVRGILIAIITSILVLGGQSIVRLIM